MNFKLFFYSLSLALFLLVSCYENPYEDNQNRPEIIKLYEIINASKKVSASEKLKILTEALIHTSANQQDTLFLKVIDQFLLFYKDSPSRKIEFCLKGIAVAEKLQSYSKLIKYFDTARNGYLSIKEYPLALRYAQKHYELLKKVGSKKQQLLSINNLGNHYFAKNNYDSAMVYYDQMNLLNRNPVDSTILNAYWINSGIIQGKNKSFDKAIESFSKSLIFNDGYSDKLTYVQNELAQLYLLKGDYGMSINLAKKAEANAKDLNKSLKISVDKTLYQIYQKKEDLRNENFYFQKFTKSQMQEDSIRIERSNELLDLDYLAKKQELSLVELNQKVEKESYNNKVLLIGIASAGIVLVLLVLFINNLRRSTNKIKTQKAVIEQLNQNLEIKVEQRTEELFEANKELIKKNFEITEALFKGQTIERKRVAAELHDNLGSTLSAIKWRLGALDSDSLNPNEREIYEGIKSMMANAYNDVRNISHNLMPAEFEKYGLEGALRKIISEINENGKIKFEFKTEGNLKNIEKKVALELYSIALELITNILKHSGASKAEVFLGNINKKLCLNIKDNGKGLVPDSKSGKGLLQINDRLSVLGGAVEFNTFLNQFIANISIPNLHN